MKVYVTFDVGDWLWRTLRERLTAADALRRLAVARSATIGCDGHFTTIGCGGRSATIGCGGRSANGMLLPSLLSPNFLI